MDFSGQTPVVVDGEHPRILKDDHSARPGAAAFSADGAWIVAGGMWTPLQQCEDKKALPPATVVSSHTSFLGDRRCRRRRGLKPEFEFTAAVAHSMVGCWGVALLSGMTGRASISGPAACSARRSS